MSTRSVTFLTLPRVGLVACNAILFKNASRCTFLPADDDKNSRCTLLSVFVEAPRRTFPQKTFLSRTQKECFEFFTDGRVRRLSPGSYPSTISTEIYPVVTTSQSDNPS